jgi:SpoU rRNA methylase family enzyme
MPYGIEQGQQQRIVVKGNVASVESVCIILYKFNRLL